MKMLKRSLAVMLALIMMISAMPFAAFASESTDMPSEPTEAVVDAPEGETPAAEEAEEEAPAADDAAEEAPAADDAAEEAPAADDAAEEAPAADDAAEEAPAADDAEADAPAVDDVAADVPAVMSLARSTSSNAYQYNIVHLDAGRKYFSPANIKVIIDNAAAAGFNQLELYLSDNQGFRFALDDMTITTSSGTYDLTSALGDGYSDGSKYPDYSGKYLTQSEMDEIIAYANSKGIDIVPCINVPGHMGAILEEFADFKYSGSASSIDLNNDEAVAFALALTEKYVKYFASQGCKYYSIGADEYANDLSTMGFEGMGQEMYNKFVDFMNDAADIIIAAGMTPRAFNDGFYYKDYTATQINSAYEVCYWSCGWSGYDVATAETIASYGHKMINTHGDYYWVLGNSSWQCSASKASQFSTTTFQSGTISDPAGAMFCIWCDVANADGQDDGAGVAADTADVIAAFGGALPTVDTLVSGSGSSEDDTTVAAPVTDTETFISVSAEGVTGLTVKDTTVPTIEGANAVVAYNIELTTESGAYVDAAMVTIPVPKTWTNVLGGVMASDNGEQVLGIEGTLENGYFTFEAPHFSDIVAYDATKSETINVSVGGTATAAVEGVDYSGNVDKSELSTSIATVDVKYEEVAGKTVSALGDQISVTNSNGWSDTGVIYNGTYYLVLSSNGEISSTTDISAATVFQISRGSNNNRYTIYSETADRYLTYSDNSLSSSTSSTNWRYSSSNGFYNNNNRYLVCSSGTWTLSNSSSSEGYFYDVTTTTTDPVEQTTITFTGVAAGTTYVTVGNTRYTINVAAEDLSKVDGLTVEFWITNVKVTANGATSMEIDASAAYGEKGVLIKDLVPADGTGSSAVAYWKATRLSSANKQTTSSGVNQTLKGTDFTYIRYYGGSWAYSADGKTWTNVLSTDQIVAYYLQVTEVTDEVTTQVVDWGEIYGNSYNDANYVLVDYAVKYESGERTPDAFPINGTTQKFHCSSDNTNVSYGNVVYDSTAGIYYRNLWSIRAIETSEYEVYMITLTPTSDSATDYLSSGADSESTGQSDFYDGTEKVVWVDDEANLGNFADESLHYTSISGDVKYSVGGDPTINELEIYNRHGMLVTYYVRAKATEDSLTVHYVDDTEDLEFYSYNIAVKQGTYFHEGIALNTSNPNGALLNGTVTNYYNNTQTVSADLSTLSQVGAQYLYTEYNCVRVERSEDGKHVYLYYTFDPTVYFVADFGLPMTITATDLSDKLKDATITDMLFTGVANTKYGKLTDNGTTVTYAPDEVLQGLDYFTLIVKTESEVSDILDEAATQIAFRVYVVPATTVYYEESFLTYTGTWSSTALPTDVQATEILGAHKYNYGYDPIYADDASASNNTKVTTTTNGDYATFTFTGTGFELYANCNEGTGYVTVTSDGSVKKMYMVDTGLNYKELGVTMPGASATPTGTFFNIPIISEKDLAYGTYTVTVRKTNSDGQSFEIDGFRVINTIDESSKTSAESIYYKDQEDKPDFYQLRDHVLNSIGIKNAEYAQVYADVSGATGIVTTAGVDYTNPDAQALLDNGPKNEIYLHEGQTLTFKVSTARAMQIGLKAPNGVTTYDLTCTGVTTKSGVAMNSSVDMFYELGNTTGRTQEFTVTVKNTGNKILAVTDLKICDDPNAAFVALTEDDVKAILGDALQEETPVEPTEPETEPTEPETEPTEPETKPTKPTKPGKPSQSQKPGNNKPSKPGKNDKEDQDETEKVATLKITFVNMRGKKVGTATITKTQTSGNRCVISASEICKQAPAGRRALWLFPVVVNYGGSASIIVPVF